MASRVVLDTPTPPSQLYSYNTLQTSLRPITQHQHNKLDPATVTAKGPPKRSSLNQQISIPSSMDEDLLSHGSSSSSSSSSFSSTGHGRNQHYQQQRPAMAQGTADPRYGGYNNKSLGYGDAGMGQGMDEQDRFTDLQSFGRQRKGGGKRTRVDELSDATLDESSHTHTEESSEDSDDEFSSRLGIRGAAQYRPTSTPFHHNTHAHVHAQSNNNISKSAFDGMARELRKEFERIMDSGKPAARTYHHSDQNTAPAGVSPAQKRRYSLQQPPINNNSINNITAAPVGVPMPRGVPPPSTRIRRDSRPGFDRKDSTPTVVRSFGQELPIFSQQPSFASHHHPGNAYQKVALSTAKHALSPFQVANPAQQPGVLPPNNTRASAAASISPNLRTSHGSSYHDHHLEDRRANPSPAKSISSYHALRVPDITGLTDGLSSPSRVTSDPSSHRHVASTGSPKSHSRSASHSVEDPALSSALVGLRRRLDALESENARSEAKVAELEDKLASAQDPALPRSAHQDELVSTLRGEIDRLQASIEDQSCALALLQVQQRTSSTGVASVHPASADPHLAGYGRENQQWTFEYKQLKESLNGLADQIAEVKRVLEEVLEGIRQMPSFGLRDQDLLRPHRPASPVTPSRRAARATKQADLLRSPAGLGIRQHRSDAQDDYYYAPTYAGPMQQQQHEQPIHHQHRAHSAHPPAEAPRAHILAQHRVQRNFSAPIPQTQFSGRTNAVDHPAREPLLERAERILSNLPPTLDNHSNANCEVCRRRAAQEQGEEQARREEGIRHQATGRPKQPEELPMQTVISRALRDLEDDFASHKRIYIELSDEYKGMDPATPDVGKRKILASHLRESIDVLELKADEIKRLYDLLHYRSELQQTQDAQRFRTLAQNMRPFH